MPGRVGRDVEALGEVIGGRDKKQEMGRDC